MTQTNDQAAEILAKLRRQGSDDANYEAKSCQQNIGGSAWESISAFANTSGGTLLLGIDEHQNFAPVDGFDANRIIDQLTEGMGDGNPQGVRLVNPPSYEISRCFENGKPFVLVEVKENAPGDKPCYIKAKGPQSGGYRRVDDKDIRLSPMDVFELENQLVSRSTDREIVPEASEKDLDDDALNTIFEIHRNSKALRGAVSKREKMTRLNITDTEGSVRLAGLLAAGTYPQQFLPKILIDVAAHPGDQKGTVGGPRFLDRVLCDGNMPDAIDQAVDATARNLRSETFIKGAGAKTDTEIPREVLREVIANAVVHREYDSRFLGESVTVDIYPDRVEVGNPGGLWGGTTLETMKRGESRCRNATLMQLMHKVPYGGEDNVTVEGGGSGIPMVLREMKSRALGTPDFLIRPDHVTVVLGRYGAEYLETRRWMANLGVPLSRREQTALLMLRQQPDMTVQQLHEALTFDSDDIREILRQLRSKGVLDFPQEDGHSTGAYRRATVRRPSATETAVLAALGDKPLSVREVHALTGGNIQVVRRALRSLVADGKVMATASPTSRNRKYLLSGR